MLGMLIAVSTALAHVPHLPVVAATDTSSGTVALVTTDARAACEQALFRLDDDGFWKGETLPTHAGVPVAVGALDGDLLLADDSGSLYRQSDGAWTELGRVDAGVVLQVGSDSTGAWIVGTTGIVHVDPAGEFTRESDVPTVAFGASSAGVAWASADGTQTRVVDGVHTTSTATEGTTALLLTTAEDGSMVEWRADASGVSRTDADGVVTACGALPISDPDLDYATFVTHIHVGDRVIVTTGQLVYASDDTCATWTEQQTSSVPANYGVGGTMYDPSEAWTFIQEPMTLYGHLGVQRQEGDHFNTLPTLGPGQAYALYPAESGQLWIGTYGAGVRALDAVAQTQSWSDPALTQNELFVHSIAGTADRVVATFDMGVMANDTTVGLGWVDIPTPLEWPSDVAYLAGTWWVTSKGGGAPGAVSGTDPVALATDSALADIVAASDFLVVQVVNGHPWALAQPGALYRSDDGGASWVLVSNEHAFVGLAGTADGRLFGVDGRELFSSSDSGATWTRPDAPDSVVGLAAGNEAIAVLETSGQVQVSMDGGASFAAWGPPFPGGVLAMTVVPDADDTVIVSTPTGLQWSVDGEWHPLPSMQRAAPLSGSVSCGTADGSACTVSATVVWNPAVGDTLSWPVYADTFSYAASEGTSVDLYDGATRLGPLLPGTEISLGTLSWHALRLVFTTADPVRGTVGWLQATGDGEWYPQDPPGDTADTGEGPPPTDDTPRGCGSCSGGTGLLLLLPLLGARRRVVIRGRPLRRATPA